MKSKFLFLFLFFFSSCAIAQDSDKTIITVAESKETTTNTKLDLVESTTVKNVIFLIGDGTGLAQISAGQLHLVGKHGLLNIQRLPVLGLIKTFAENSLITDSAAGATAFSCGERTNNGMIAMLPNDEPCKTILEYAVENGMSTALLSTSGVTHATPASYASHVPSRNMYSEIADQYLEAGVDVILGGGWEDFMPSTKEGSRRTDERELTTEFEDRGYDVLFNKDDMNNSSSDKLLGLFSQGGLIHENSEPSLAEMTTKSLEILSKNEKGFFMMIEGSQIDWGSHQNDASYVMREVKSFDDAIGVVLDFAKDNGETLVVITADHETGGMTMNKNLEDGKKMEIAWTTGGHTGIPVPLMAYGPKALEFSGWHSNIEVGRILFEIMGIN